MVITVRPAMVNVTVANNVKQYILAVCRLDYASWPSSNYYCILWKNDMPYTVRAGAKWAFSGSIVYTDSDSDCEIPSWVPGALMCIAIQFCLDTDPEVVEAIESLIEELRLRFRRGVERATASSIRNRPVRRIALSNTEEKELAYYKVDTDEEEEKMEWRDHEGNSYEIDEQGEEWTVIEI